MAEFPANNTGSIISDIEAEVHSSIGSNAFESSSFQLIVEKLNRKNFRKWAQSIKLIIKERGKLGYLIGETKKPADRT